MATLDGIMLEAGRCCNCVRTYIWLYVVFGATLVFMGLCVTFAALYYTQGVRSYFIVAMVMGIMACALLANVVAPALLNSR